MWANYCLAGCVELFEEEFNLLNRLPAGRLHGRREESELIRS